MFRSVLSDRTIRRYNRKGLLIEGEIDDQQLQPNSVDLTLSDDCKELHWNCVTQSWPSKNFPGFNTIIDTKVPIKYNHREFQRNGENKKYIVIRSNEFLLMSSREILNIPNGILGFVQGRSSVARLGIQTEQAGLIDAGFRGTITFEVYNQSPYAITLYEGMRIAQAYFFKAQKAKQLYGKEHGSKYYGQMQATGSRINEDIK